MDRTVGALALSRRPRLVALVLLALALTAPADSRCSPPPAQPRRPAHDEPPGTFSILGYDPATGEVGGAVQSRVFSVGNGVLWAEAGVGAAATQAIVDVSYGPKALELLKAGMTPAAIIHAILASDPDPGLNGQSWTEGGPAVRRHGRQGQLRRVHRPEGDAVGRQQGRQVLHRAGQHPRRRSGRRRHGRARSKRRPATCRCA